MRNVRALCWFSVATLVLFSACSSKKATQPVPPKAPTVSTAAVSVVTETTAQCGGTITADGGAAVTACGVCWSTNVDPTTADSKTADAAASGSFSSSATGLTAGTQYYIRAYATNSAGTGYGAAESFTTTAASTTVTDIDGHVYPTVTIGTQVWMAENLKVAHYRNGDAIPNVPGGLAWEALMTGAYCEYDNSADSADVYGRLYNWYAVNDSRNVAPEGWHVPSHAEWQTLVWYLASDAGGKMKEADTAHWASPNTGATNESGFTALPAGMCGYQGLYIGMPQQTWFWSSSEYPNGRARVCELWSYSAAAEIGGHLSKYSGLSIRCVKD